MLTVFGLVGEDGADELFVELVGKKKLDEMASDSGAFHTVEFGDLLGGHEEIIINLD